MSALTIEADNGATASAGANVGFYATTTQPVDFEIPDDAVIVGIGGRRGSFFHSVFFAYRESS